MIWACRKVAARAKQTCLRELRPATKVLSFPTPVPLYIEETPSSNNTCKVIDNAAGTVYDHFGINESRTARMDCTQKNTILNAFFTCIFLRMHVYSYLLWHDSYEA